MIILYFSAHSTHLALKYSEDLLKKMSFILKDFVAEVSLAGTYVFENAKFDMPEDMAV
jgi:hypothetical protein